MSLLFVPIAPLSQSKSRLMDDCFTPQQLEEFTIAMFIDLASKLENLQCFDKKIIYCNSAKILELSHSYKLTVVKEPERASPDTLDEIIEDLKDLSNHQFNAKQMLISFLDVILITKKNFEEMANLLEKNQLLVCPAIHSAGISVLGGNPPNLIPPCFSDPNIPSLIAFFRNAQKKNLRKIAVYDSFRAGFDVDLKEDCLLAYEYLKILNLTHTKAYKFLEKNLSISLEKTDVNNNRNYKIIEKK